MTITIEAALERCTPAERQYAVQYYTESTGTAEARITTDLDRLSDKADVAAALIVWAALAAKYQ